MEQVTTQPSNSPKYAFYYLLSLFTLLFTAISVGIVIFQIINKYIFDALEQYNFQYQQEPLKFAISALIITTPIFFLTMRQIYKSLASGILSKEAGVRKWLSYFVLLVTAVVMIFWIITTINQFLSGELGIKAGLKTLTVLAIAASIFSFYFYDIRRKEVVNQKDKIISIYFYASLTVIVAAFIFSLFIVESPTATRNRMLDEVILNNFSNIDGALNSYYSQYGKLPASLDELLKVGNYIVSSNLVDVSTNKQFEYKVKADKSYELCATFKASNKDPQASLNTYLKERWPHDAGNQCINQQITAVKGTISVPAVMK
jgi:hypothetical protein